jgi:hypothetical protein
MQCECALNNIEREVGNAQECELEEYVIDAYKIKRACKPQNEQ